MCSRRSARLITQARKTGLRAALARVSELGYVSAVIHQRAGTLVLAARLGVARAEGYVEAAADLFIEQDLAGEARDTLVGANGELATKRAPIL